MEYPVDEHLKKFCGQRPRHVLSRSLWPRVEAALSRPEPRRPSLRLAVAGALAAFVAVIAFSRHSTQVRRFEPLPSYEGSSAWPMDPDEDSYGEAGRRGLPAFGLNQETEAL